MPIIFAGNELIPAPLVDVRRDFVRGEDSKILHPEYVYTLTGTIVNIGNNLDSPGASGYPFANMEGVLSEEKRIREIFDVDGGRLEISTPGGGGPNTIDAYCFVDSVDFQRSTWTQRCDYTIVLRSRRNEGDNENIVELQSFNETWSITENQDSTYVLSHNLRAVGALIYGSSGVNDPLGAARNWCKTHSYTIDNNGNLTPVATGSLTYSNLISPLSSSSGFNFWNYSCVESPYSEGYGWSLTENFVYNPSGQTREEWNASINYEADNPRKVVIGIQGSVYGFADRLSNLTLRNQRAKSYYENSVDTNLYTRILGYAPGGFSVNPIPTSKQISYERINGALRYAVSYTAASGNLIPNALEESVNVSDTGQNDIFAQIPVPGRKEGPIIQYMFTSTLPERTVTINAVMTNTSVALTPASLANLYAAKPNTDSIVQALMPNNGNYYIRQNSEEWNPIKRQYNRVVSWFIDLQGQTVSGIPNSTGLNNLPKS